MGTLGTLKPCPGCGKTQRFPRRRQIDELCETCKTHLKQMQEQVARPPDGARRCSIQIGGLRATAEVNDAWKTFVSVVFPEVTADRFRSETQAGVRDACGWYRWLNEHQRIVYLTAEQIEAVNQLLKSIEEFGDLRYVEGTKYGHRSMVRLAQGAISANDFAGLSEK